MRMRKRERREVEDGGGGERLFLDCARRAIERYVPPQQLSCAPSQAKACRPTSTGAQGNGDRVRPEAKKKMEKKNGKKTD